MEQAERRKYLIRALLDEQPKYRDTMVPDDIEGQKRLLRSLMNVRMPQKTSGEFLKIQDDYLKEEIKQKGITDIADMKPIKEGIYLWKGDITTLKCDAIVNAANPGMTGCYIPCHACIDNCIHTYSGVQLRYRCSEMISEQGHEEPTGMAKITPAYNLPSKYILHTVGPIVSGKLAEGDENALESCYLSCLEKARENAIKSVAFCCISTGAFRFPNQRAAEIAVHTVERYRKDVCSGIEIIFNVWKDIDLEIYRKLLG